MNAQISSKLAALVIALLVNGVILGATAYLFSNPGTRASIATIAQAMSQAHGAA